MKQTAIAFVWDFTVAPLDLYGWADGLNEALQILADKYGWYVKVIANDDPDQIYKEIEEINPSAIICWGSLDRPSFAGIKSFNVPTALCFAGGPTSHPQAENFDVIFVENEVYEKAFKAQGYNVKRAFGTNSNLFIPMPTLSKKWIGIYPAAFANWKRHQLFAEALGHDGLALGKFIEEEYHNVQVCADNHVTIMPQVPYYAIPYLYNQSRFAVVTSNSAGGGQRSVLEAMSCDIPPIVMRDNEKTSEYVLDSGFGKVVEPTKEAIQEAIAELMIEKPKGGRDYILKKYSAAGYASSLYDGIVDLLPKK